MTQLQPVPEAPEAPQSRDRGTVLALELNTREIGYAVATREHVHSYGVLNIRKLNSNETKQSSFRKKVQEELDRRSVGRIVLVQPLKRQLDRPLVRLLLLWLRQEAQRRDLPLELHDRADVKAAVAGPDAIRASNREVARRLITRFPQLRAFAPPSDLVRGHLVPTASKLAPNVTSKERYWTHMFLALAAGIFDLDREIRRELENKLPQ